MRTAFLMLPLVALAACATPREQCINDVTRDTRVLNALVNQTRGNISRGYALEQHQQVRTVRGTCRGHNEDGTRFLFSCEETNTINTSTPVAIDLNAEQAKLASLQERLAQSQTGTNQAVAQCIAIHPS
ncbi:MAG: hypothetical protein ACJAZ1_000011 [Yoonia sp.]|jgi:hypothetical protein